MIAQCNIKDDRISETITVASIDTRKISLHHIINNLYPMEGRFEHAKSTLNIIHEPQRLHKAIEHWLDREVLYREAQRTGWNYLPEIQGRMEAARAQSYHQIRQNVLDSWWIDEMEEPLGYVSGREKRITMRVIVVQQKGHRQDRMAYAKKVQNLWKAAAFPAYTARQFSYDAIDRKNGGNRGWHYASSLPKAITQKKYPIGTVFDPIEELDGALGIYRLAHYSDKLYKRWFLQRILIPQDLPLSKEHNDHAKRETVLIQTRLSQGIPFRRLAKEHNSSPYLKHMEGGIAALTNRINGGLKELSVWDWYNHCIGLDLDLWDIQKNQITQPLDIHSGKIFIKMLTKKNRPPHNPISISTWNIHDAAERTLTMLPGKQVLLLEKIASQARLVHPFPLTKLPSADDPLVIFDNATPIRWGDLHITKISDMAHVKKNIDNILLGRAYDIMLNKEERSLAERIRKSKKAWEKWWIGKNYKHHLKISSGDDKSPSRRHFEQWYQNHRVRWDDDFVAALGLSHTRR